MYPLMGESILLSESSDLWKNKRRVLSASFYKDKLLKMIDLAKLMVKETVEEWNKSFIQEQKPFELIEEISLL